MGHRPHVVGIGGTVVPESSTEQALCHALAAVAAGGGRTSLFGGEYLSGLPHYGSPDSRGAGADLIAAVRGADAIIFASPGYHGTISGLLKNAIDYIEETSRDQRTYLDGLPVGLIATAYGWQAAVSTLGTMRTIAHALRGWPTPLGVAINTSGGTFRDGHCHDEAIARQLDTLGQQVIEFSHRHQPAAV